MDDDRIVTGERLVEDVGTLRRREGELECASAESEGVGHVYRTVFESLGDAVFVADAESGAIVDCNRQAEALLGRTRDEIIGLHQTQLHPPGQEEQRQREFQQHIADNRPFIDSEVARKDGSVVPVSVGAAVVTIQGQRRIIGVFRDISERQNMLKALRSERDRGQGYLDLAGVMFVALDANGMVALANKKACEVLECDESGIVGKDWFDQCLPEPIREDVRSVFRTLVGGEIEPVEYHENPVLTRTGKQRLIAWHNTVLRDDSGRITGTLSSGEDITERKRAEKALKKSEERYRLLVENVPAVTWSTDEQGRTTYISPSIERVYGFTQQEIYDGGAALWFGRIHPHDIGRVRRAFADLFENDTRFDTEYRIQRKDGAWIWLRDQADLIKDEEGERRAYGVFSDVTERKRAEQLTEERLKFENLLSELSTSLLSTPPSGADEEIERCLQRVLTYVGADRAHVRHLDDRVAPSRQRTSQVTAAGTPLSPYRDPEAYPWVVSRIGAGDLLCFSDPNELPAEASREKELCEQEGIRAAMVVPMIAGERLVGSLSFSCLSEQRNWPPDLVDRMRLVANVFADAFERKRAHEELESALSEVRELKERVEAENVYLRKEMRMAHRHGDFVVRSEGMQAVLHQAEAVAKTDSTVLILGETGTGKELLARAIHDMSARKEKPLVIVNCAAMPAALVESELFGREKGAYTGALTKQVGRFEMANGGTIFLDEIGELSGELQAKLLRVLQEGQFERLGSSKTITVDVRVIAATNANLERLVEQDRFRKDFFYRLNVFPITIPPLRDRREDIEPLVWSFVTEFATRMGKRIETISHKGMDALREYAWPGNIRELRNVIERAVILTQGKALRVEPPRDTAKARTGQKTLEQLEKEHILDVLEKTGWRIRGKGGVAEILGINPSTLESRMKKLGISRPR